MNKHLLRLCRTLFSLFFSRFIPVRTFAFWTNSRVFFFGSWDPFMSTPFASESVYSDPYLPHSYRIYYFQVYKFSVYYNEIFIYLISIHFISNIPNK